MRPQRWNPSAAVRGFDLPGTVESLEPYGSGHINDTYLVVSAAEGAVCRNVLQRINHDVFKDPGRLMQNVERVALHVQRKAEAEGKEDAGRRALRLVPARDGRSFLEDADGAWWRVYRFVEGARSWDVAGSPERVYQASRAFALFSRRLFDLPSPRLHDTIPRFHDTPGRFGSFLAALESDPLGRSREARPEIEAYLARQPLSEKLARPLAEGRLTERVAHNDTKLNNVLIDDVTGEGLCVIDLDTVMPGLFLYDFGDLVRSATNPAEEDERDLARVVADAGLFAALVRGALEVMTDVLTPLERDSLVVAGEVLTFECGMRFLTDHLLGDSYFRVHRPSQNLDRARAQLALLRSIESREEELARIVERAQAEVGREGAGHNPAPCAAGPVSLPESLSPRGCA